MKQKYLLIILLACISHIGFAQTTTIPDPIFETFLEANGMGNGIANDNLVTTANIVNRTILHVENLGIGSLIGIEDFTSLITLFAEGNSLQDIDLSNLTNLNFVTLHDNTLTSLNISNNPSLGSLTAWNNGLTSIDITGCVGLTELYLQDNMLTDLDLSLFPNLNAINLTNNQ
jgi:Leucine-rich repeat (LRR) protein